MTIPIDSGALDPIKRILGLTLGGAERAFLDDGNVSQTLDVRPMARRAGLVAPTEGLVSVALRSDIGAGGGDTDDTLDPYVPAVNLQGYPARVPESRELWLLGATCIQVNGSIADAGEYVLSCTWDPIPQGKTNVAIDVPNRFPLAVWAATPVLPSGTACTDADPAALTSVQGEAFARLNVRLPRGVTLRFRGSSTGTARVFANLYCGLFPIAAGQDLAQ